MPDVPKGQTCDKGKRSTPVRKSRAEFGPKLHRDTVFSGSMSNRSRPPRLFWLAGARLLASTFFPRLLRVGEPLADRIFRTFGRGPDDVADLVGQRAFARRLPRSFGDWLIAFGCDPLNLSNALFELSCGNVPNLVAVATQLPPSIDPCWLVQALQTCPGFQPDGLFVGLLEHVSETNVREPARFTPGRSSHVTARWLWPAGFLCAYGNLIFVGRFEKRRLPCCRSGPRDLAGPASLAREAGPVRSAKAAALEPERLSLVSRLVVVALQGSPPVEVRASTARASAEGRGRPF